MRHLRFFGILAVVIAAVLVASAEAIPQQRGPAAPPPAVPLDQLKLQPGFRISVFAEGVRNARGMALGAKGTVFVGSMSARTVYAVIDKNGDGVADEIKTIATGVALPAGVAFRNGALYYSSVTRIFRMDDIEDHLDNPPTPVVVYDKLPNNQGHNWRYIAFGPDGLLYIGLGSPCNVCDKELTDDPRLATIVRMKPDGTDFEIFAHGVRNTVGFDWYPVTHEMWFSDNGRDNLGDDMPSDELNVATKPGQHFGYPFCNQGDVVDPDVGKGHTCAEFVPPILKVGPHVASIGLKFYTGSMFPPQYKNAVIVAQHGSWNRSQPIGYRVMVVRNDGHKVLDYQPFVDGFLHGIRGTPGTPPDGRSTGDAYARPADTLVLKDGSVLISDDQGGRIFRVTYGK